MVVLRSQAEIDAWNDEQRKLCQEARDRLPGLQAEYLSVRREMDSKQDALKAIQRRLDRIPAAMVDAGTLEAKQALVKERHDLLEQQEIVTLELQGLSQRGTTLDLDVRQTALDANG